MNEISSTSLILSQLRSLIKALTDQAYEQPLDVFNGSSIGQHVRHIIEFYSCMIGQHGQGQVCYDHRERNPDIEQNRKFALSVLEQIEQDIPKLDVRQELMLKVAPDAQSDDSFTTATTVGRELIYGFDHAVHHLAIVKIGLQLKFPEIVVDQNLGVAPSTVKYRERVYADLPSA